MGYPLLPLDCLLEIFEKITDDNKSLYSCLLVNRIWCQAAMPILWEKPLHDSISFKFNQVQWKSLSRTIFHCIPNENLEYLQKTNSLLLKDQLNDSSNKLMFNYIEFIQYLSVESIHKLITHLLFDPTPYTNDLPPKFSYTYHETLLEKELWKIFLKHSVTLKRMEHPSFPIFIYPNALTRLGFLIHLECSPMELGTLMFEDLSSSCQNLERLSLNYSNGVIESVGSGINESVSKFISMQNGLKEVEFYCPNFNHQNLEGNDVGGINNQNLREFKKEFNKFIGKSLLKHKNTLKSIIFKENVYIFSNILNQLKNVKKFEFKSILGNYTPNHRVGFHNETSVRGLNYLENVKWSNLECLIVCGINVETEFETFVKLIQGTSDSFTTLTQELGQDRTQVESQQQQTRQGVNGLLRQVNIETDSTMPNPECIKSYYQSLIRFGPSLEVVTIWYLDEYKDDFEILIKSSPRLKEITLLIHNDDVPGNNNGDAILTFIFNTLSSYAGSNLSTIKFGEGWNISVKVLYEFLQRWRERKSLFIYYHMEIDITEQHLQVFENFKNIGVLK
ncbi:2364_t:CDS:2, partial [Funneliformis caledonium]